MDVLCFDVASGGVSGARIDEALNVLAYAELPWSIASLTGPDVQNVFRRVAETLRIRDGAAAISIASFMHGFLVVDSAGTPVTPVFTWRDTADEGAVDRIKRQLAGDFHERTGCHYHPMFPVFKLAAMKVLPSQKVVSPKAWLIWNLTGQWNEDDGMASASGLFNLRYRNWDADILRILDLPLESLPHVVDRESVIGTYNGIPVIAGSGDGFMATLGSGCELPGRVAVTLGTTASARQFVSKAVLNESSGTFCYRANRDSYLLGCAGNNGGNVLEWARSVFGGLDFNASNDNIPIFLPMLHGERSPDWNSRLRASFHDIGRATTIEALSQAVLEGVIFNLAHYVEILNSSAESSRVILSGNGFLDPVAGRILASLVREDVLQPEVGLATLRGAAMLAWRALGNDPGPAMEDILAKATRVAPLFNTGLTERCARYKQLRFRASDL